MKTITINNVKFRLGILHREDAVGQMRTALPSFKVLREGKTSQGRTISTVGWIARIGNYWLVISEKVCQDGIYDYTLVPGRAKVKLE